MADEVRYHGPQLAVRPLRLRLRANDFGSIAKFAPWQHEKLRLQGALEKENRVKRYLLFGGDGHYPDGGWDDFHGAFNFLASAIETADKLIEEMGHYPLHGDKWCHLVDTETGIIRDGKWNVEAKSFGWTERPPK